MLPSGNKHRAICVNAGKRRLRFEPGTTAEWAGAFVFALLAAPSIASSLYIAFERPGIVSGGECVMLFASYALAVIGLSFDWVLRKRRSEHEAASVFGEV